MIFLPVFLANSNINISVLYLSLSLSLKSCLPRKSLNKRIKLKVSFYSLYLDPLELSLDLSKSMIQLMNL